MYSHNDKIDARSKETVLASITGTPREIPKHQKYAHTVNPYIKNIHILLFLEREREEKRGNREKELEREREV